MADVAIKFPSATAITVAYLDGHPLMPADACVSADLVGFEHGALWAHVFRSGGLRPIRYRIDQPRLDFNCYGATKPDAEDLSESVMAAMLNMHTATHDGAVVTAVTVVQNAADLTDPDNNQPRYVTSLELTLHPHTA